MASGDAFELLSTFIGISAPDLPEVEAQIESTLAKIGQQLSKSQTISVEVSDAVAGIATVIDRFQDLKAVLDQQVSLGEITNDEATRKLEAFSETIGGLVGNLESGQAGADGFKSAVEQISEAVKRIESEAAGIDEVFDFGDTPFEKPIKSAQALENELKQVKQAATNAADELKTLQVGDFTAQFDNFDFSDVVDIDVMVDDGPLRDLLGTLDDVDASAVRLDPRLASLLGTFGKFAGVAGGLLAINLALRSIDDIVQPQIDQVGELIRVYSGLNAELERRRGIEKRINEERAEGVDDAIRDADERVGFLQQELAIEEKLAELRPKLIELENKARADREDARLNPFDVIDQGFNDLGDDGNDQEKRIKRAEASQKALKAEQALVARLEEARDRVAEAEKRITKEIEKQLEIDRIRLNQGDQAANEAKLIADGFTEQRAKELAAATAKLDADKEAAKELARAEAERIANAEKLGRQFNNQIEQLKVQIKQLEDGEAAAARLRAEFDGLGVDKQADIFKLELKVEELRVQERIAQEQEREQKRIGDQIRGLELKNIEINKGAAAAAKARAEDQEANPQQAQRIADLVKENEEDAKRKREDEKAVQDALRDQDRIQKKIEASRKREQKLSESRDFEGLNQSSSVGVARGTITKPIDGKEKELLEEAKKHTDLLGELKKIDKILKGVPGQNQNAGRQFGGNVGQNQGREQRRPERIARDPEQLRDNLTAPVDHLNASKLAELVLQSAKLCEIQKGLVPITTGIAETNRTLDRISRKNCGLS